MTLLGTNVAINDDRALRLTTICKGHEDLVFDSIILILSFIMHALRYGRFLKKEFL